MPRAERQIVGGHPRGRAVNRYTLDPPCKRVPLSPEKIRDASPVRRIFQAPSFEVFFLLRIFLFSKVGRGRGIVVGGGNPNQAEMCSKCFGMIVVHLWRLMVHSDPRQLWTSRWDGGIVFFLLKLTHNNGEILGGEKWKCFQCNETQFRQGIKGCRAANSQFSKAHVTET